MDRDVRRFTEFYLQTFTQVIAPYGNKRSRNPYFTSVNAPYFTPVKITTLSLKGLSGQSVVFAMERYQP